MQTEPAEGRPGLGKEGCAGPWAGRVPSMGGSSQDEPASKPPQLARLHGKRYGAITPRRMRRRAASVVPMNKTGPPCGWWLNSRRAQNMTADFPSSHTPTSWPQSGQAMRPTYRPAEMISAISLAPALPCLSKSLLRSICAPCACLAAGSWLSRWPASFTQDRFSGSLDARRWRQRFAAVALGGVSLPPWGGWCLQPSAQPRLCWRVAAGGVASVSWPTVCPPGGATVEGSRDMNRAWRIARLRRPWQVACGQVGALLGVWGN